MSTDSAVNAELVRLSRAVRFGLASIVLGLSYPNIHCALNLKVFLDAFPGGKGMASVLMHDYQPLFVALSILLPIAAMANVFMTGVVRSIYLSGFLVIAVFVQLFFQYFAMMGPISNITGNA